MKTLDRFELIEELVRDDLEDIMNANSARAAHILLEGWHGYNHMPDRELLEYYVELFLKHRTGDDRSIRFKFSKDVTTIVTALEDGLSIAGVEFGYEYL